MCEAEILDLRRKHDKGPKIGYAVSPLSFNPTHVSVAVQTMMLNVFDDITSWTEIKGRLSSSRYWLRTAYAVAIGHILGAFALAPSFVYIAFADDNISSIKNFLGTMFAVFISPVTAMAAVTLIYFSVPLTIYAAPFVFLFISILRSGRLRTTVYGAIFGLLMLWLAARLFVMQPSVRGQIEMPRDIIISIGFLFYGAGFGWSAWKFVLKPLQAESDRLSQSNPPR